jgi:predicted nucleic acid-binding protein
LRKTSSGKLQSTPRSPAPSAVPESKGARDDQRITYTDAVSFAVMKSRKCDAVLGFDHDFIVAGFRFWRAE